MNCHDIGVPYAILLKCIAYTLTLETGTEVTCNALDHWDRIDLHTVSRDEQLNNSGTIMVIPAESEYTIDEAIPGNIEVRINAVTNDWYIYHS